MKTKQLGMIAAAWVLGELLALSAAAVSAAEPSASAPIRLHIAAQPLPKALAALAAQTGVQLIFSSTEVAKSLQAPALEGDYTVHGALEKLLANTALSYEYVNERTVAIRPSKGRNAVQTDKVSDRSTNDETNSSRLARVDEPEGRQSEVSSSTTSNEEEKQHSVQEIIVTATKRVQNMQDVPISMTALTADDIDRRGLAGAEDYLRGIPGINQMDSVSGQLIVIRGIETAAENQNFASGSNAATYFGETPTTSSAGLSGGGAVDLKLVDIERVEVLRGPQGTAFGNASMGGAVRTIPVAPKLDRFEAKLGAGYSTTSGAGGDNYNVQATGNLPLIDGKLAIRATGYQYEDSGFYRNRAASDTNFQAAVVSRYGVQAFATDEAEVGGYYAIGGRIAALFQATEDLRLTLSYLTQKTERDGVAVSTIGTYDQATLQVAPEHVVRGQKGGVFDTDIDLANAVIEYNLGWGNLLATYSHIESGATRSAPYTALPIALPVSTKADSNHREHVGEVRLATQLDGVWNFLGGLYAEDIKDDYFNTWIWYGDQAMNTFGSRLMGTYPDSRSQEQRAAFGEVTWEIIPRLTLAAGVRAYEYDRTYRVDGVGPLLGADGLHRDVATEDSGENFRANLSYKFQDGALLYAGWSQGFRLGRLQAGAPPGLCDRDGNGIVDGSTITVESTRRLDSDEVDSYELGSKFALFDRRLTVSADIFRMKWSGIPVTVFGGSCAVGWFANAGDALSEGAEFQGSLQLSEPVRVDFGGSWIHARLSEDVPALRAAKDNRLPGSPEISANLAVQYEFGIGGYQASVRADSIYVGPFYSDLLESPATKAGDYMKLDVSARVDIGNLNIDLFVRNLTSEDAFTYRGPTGGGLFGYRLRPRTIGVQLGYRFK